MNGTDDSQRLRKELGLMDVFAISTGAMFSSGFFLLPGIAAATSGPSVVLAYFFAGLLILPAMLSMAELSTAMPRAGGAYYFLDRSLGPVVGTVGGLGTWIALVFKSAFALLGIGAYLTLLMEVPVREVTLALTLAFVVLNIVGAKETTRLQKVLVWILLVVVALFIFLGFGWMALEGPSEVIGRQFTPLMPFGVEGLFGTVGLVFVSYAGLTKVASVAEEVKDPDRNIPLGMILSLAAATTAYVAGVFVMVAVLDPAALRSDLTPVATAATGMLDGVPGLVAMGLVVAAAFAAFASTGNAGIMSASRYVLAMARDGHLWSFFATLGRFRTPTLALGVTGAAIALSILTFDVEGVAKLASAFQLLIFGLVNLSVIVMRESWIESYEPGFRSPFYPWLHIVGFLVPFLLIAQMGWLAVLFVAGVTAVGIVWYHAYVREHLVREGAIYHVFERLGRQRYSGLESELRQILQEKGISEIDVFSSTIATAYVLDLGTEEAPGAPSLEGAIEEASARLAPEISAPPSEIAARFTASIRGGYTVVGKMAAIVHLRVGAAEESLMVLVRARPEIEVPSDSTSREVPALFFIASPREHPERHLDLLARLAARVEEADFESAWLKADGPEGLKATLLRERSTLSIRIRRMHPSEQLANRSIRELDLPAGVLVVLVRREDQTLFPTGETELLVNDAVTFIGVSEGLTTLEETYGWGQRRSVPAGKEGDQAEPADQGDQLDEEDQADQVPESPGTGPNT